MQQSRNEAGAELGCPREVFFPLPRDSGLPLVHLGRQRRVTTRRLPSCPGASEDKGTESKQQCSPVAFLSQSTSSWGSFNLGDPYLISFEEKNLT